MIHPRSLAFALTLALALALPSAASGDPSPSAAPRRDEAAVERYFTNTELVDQDGVPRRFYRDLLRGRRVLINFAFTTCTGVCGPMTQNLARVQRLLGARVGTDVVMITITVDPVNDTPAVLKAFAAKFKAGPGWSFLTGTPANVAAVLGRLGGAVARPSDHTATLLLGDLSTGVWVKTFATERPETIAHAITHLSDDLHDHRREGK